MAFGKQHADAIHLYQRGQHSSWTSLASDVAVRTDVFRKELDRFGSRGRSACGAEPTELYEVDATLSRFHLGNPTVRNPKRNCQLTLRHPCGNARLRELFT